MPGILRMASGDITADHVFCRSVGSAGAVCAAGSLQRAFQRKAASSAGIRRIASSSARRGWSMNRFGALNYRYQATREAVEIVPCRARIDLRRSRGDWASARVRPGQQTTFADNRVQTFRRPLRPNCSQSFRRAHPPSRGAWEGELRMQIGTHPKGGWQAMQSSARAGRHSAR
jgi:hypothetical protein